MTTKLNCLCRALLLGWLVFATGQRLTAEETGHIPPVTASVLDATNHLGFWIWEAKTLDKQTCRLWRAFEVPASPAVVRGQLGIAVDNGYRLFFDGREIGRGSDWRTVTIYDLTWQLTPGTHVLAVEGFNDADKAGLIAGLRMELIDGRFVEIASDPSWRIVPSPERNWESKKTADNTWPNARVVGRMGYLPWWSGPTKVVSSPPLLPISVHFWQNGWFQITLLVVCGLAALTCLSLMAKLSFQTKAQSLLQIERVRIARDIHDDLGATLTQLVLTAEVAQSKLPAGSDTRLQFDQICESTREVLDAIDEVVWVVNSQRDTLSDFVNYVCKHAQSFLRSTTLRCRFDVEGELPAGTLDLPLRRNLLLAVKEAISNAAKHSEATEMFVRIRREGSALIVIVEDNGKGFIPAEADAERNGLTNMAQRMKELGGVCQVLSHPGTGCRVKFKIPLKQIQATRRRFPWIQWHRPTVAKPVPPAPPVSPQIT